MNVSDRALCSATLRALSNPEGINQYSMGQATESAFSDKGRARVGTHDGIAGRGDKYAAGASKIADKSNDPEDHKFAADAHERAAVVHDEVAAKMSSSIWEKERAQHVESATAHREIAAEHMKKATNRALENPEGINQYSKGGAESDHTSLLEKFAPGGLGHSNA